MLKYDPHRLDCSSKQISVLGKACVGLFCVLGSLFFSAGTLNVYAQSAGEPPISNAVKPAPERRCVLLFTLDTWRADAIGMARKLRVRTPNFDRLAKEGAWLKAHTPVPLTAPAHASILTGLNPYRHGIRDNANFSLNRDVMTLGDSFRQTGYTTAAFVSAEPLRARIGLSHGFDTYDDSGFRRSSPDTVEPGERTADETVAALKNWLASANPRKSLFLWVHFYDPHFPYVTHQVYPGKPPANGYAGEVEFADQQFGRVMRQLEQFCPADAIRVVATGDHGEGFREHGETSHGNGLYESTLSVPLLFWPRPEGINPAHGETSLLDIAPTLRQWSGLPATESDGRSLFVPETNPPRWLYAESVSPSVSFGVSPAYAMRRGDEIALLHGGKEAFNTKMDPGEKINLELGAETAFYRLAREELQKLSARQPAVETFRPTATPMPEEVRKLKSLGYVGGVLPVAGSWQKDDRTLFIIRFEKMQSARTAFFTGKLDDAIKGYEEFLGYYPRAAQTRQEYGIALFKAGKAVEARAALEEAARLNPRDPIALLNLGNLAALRGEMPVARDYYQRSLTLDEGQPEALLNLANTLLREGRLAEAVPYLKRFLAVAPDDKETPKIREIIRQAETKQH